ncbi:MAG: hypothetical protein U1A78_30715 [Polyangia bacterium]
MAATEDSREQKAIAAIQKLIERAQSYIEQITYENHYDEHGEPYKVERSDLLSLTNAALLYMEAYTDTGSPRIKNTNTLHRSLMDLHERYLKAHVTHDNNTCRSLGEFIGILDATRMGIESGTFHVIAPNKITADISRTLYEISKYPPDYIADTALREIVQRDLNELKFAVQAEMPKSAALLIGCIVEAVLLAVVGLNSTVAESFYPKKPRKFPSDFGIIELVHVCLEANLLDPELKKHVDSLNHYRDLIHPNREKSDAVKLDDASIAHGLSLLRLVLRSLADSAHAGRTAAYQKR